MSDNDGGSGSDNNDDAWHSCLFLFWLETISRSRSAHVVLGSYLPVMLGCLISNLRFFGDFFTKRCTASKFFTIIRGISVYFNYECNSTLGNNDDLLLPGSRLGLDFSPKRKEGGREEGGVHLWSVLSPFDFDAKGSSCRHLFSTLPSGRIIFTPFRKISRMDESELPKRRFRKLLMYLSFWIFISFVFFLLFSH